jgi:hypothetical protein
MGNFFQKKFFFLIFPTPHKSSLGGRFGHIKVVVEPVLGELLQVHQAQTSERDSDK